QERDQQRLPLHQGPLRLRFCRPSRAPHPAVDSQEWLTFAGNVGRTLQPHRTPLRRNPRQRGGPVHRCNRLHAHHQRRELPALEICPHVSPDQQRRPPSHRGLPCFRCCPARQA